MSNLNNKVFEAVNWNRESSPLAKLFWDQQWKQMWLPEEIAVSKDLKQWRDFEDKQTFIRVFAGLTLLDTIQTNIGMNEIAKYSPDLMEKAVCTVFGAFEAIHAKSYSYIFTTLLSNTEIDELFEWARTNPLLQKKARIIESIYSSIDENDETTLWKAQFASVMLESFLFYSGFFYPLYLGGQGKLRNSAEIIGLIIRDESLHGVAVGEFAKQRFVKFPKSTQDELTGWAYELLSELYENELAYTDYLYKDIGLSKEVKAFVRYNANKALVNIGLDKMFPDEAINPTVLNGIDTTASTHDFFSQKGTGYAVAKVEPITDATFDLSDVEL